LAGGANKLRTALFRAGQSRAPVSTPLGALTMGSSTHMVSIRVRPAREEVGQGFVLVVFEDAMTGGDGMVSYADFMAFVHPTTATN
jgi:hypothetical protein